VQNQGDKFRTFERIVSIPTILIVKIFSVKKTRLGQCVSVLKTLVYKRIYSEGIGRGAVKMHMQSI
jgi:hypothetical protein